MEMEKYHETLENSDSTTMTQIDDDDNTGVGRTYECSYCKRGFTNAQALGGHMNIHRKDKAKAKHNQQQPQNNNLYSSPTITYKYDNPGFSSYTKPSRFVSPQMGLYGTNNIYQPYNYPFGNTMPSQPSIYGSNDYSSGRTHLYGMYEDNLGVDLSLRTNSSNMVDYFRKSEENTKEDKYGAIDLELRLGYKKP